MSTFKFGRGLQLRVRRRVAVVRALRLTSRGLWKNWFSSVVSRGKRRREGREKKYLRILYPSLGENTATDASFADLYHVPYRYRPLGG